MTNLSGESLKEKFDCRPSVVNNFTTKDRLFSYYFRNPSPGELTRAQLEADILCEVSSLLDICWYCYLYFVNNDSEEWAQSWACSPLVGATRWLLNLFSLKIKSSSELFVCIIVIFTCYLCQEDPGSSLITKLRRERVLRVVPQRLEMGELSSEL